MVLNKNFNNQVITNCLILIKKKGSLLAYFLSLLNIVVFFIILYIFYKIALSIYFY